MLIDPSYSVENRLIALGWGPEVEQLKSDHSYENNKQFSIATKLTQGGRFLFSCLPHLSSNAFLYIGWEKIAPEFIQLVETTRNARIEAERSAVLHERHLTLQKLYKDYVAENTSKETYLPPFGDIMACEIFDSVLWDTPLDTTVTEEDFADGFTMVPAFIEEWKQKKTEKLLQLVREARPTTTVESLGSVDTIFYCRYCGCSKPLYYPQVLNHSCFTGARRNDSYNPRNDSYNPYLKLGQYPWTDSPYSVNYSVSMSDRMKAILQACGLPSDVTWDQLDELNPMLECKTCEESVRGRYFLRWRKAVSVHSTTLRSELYLPNSFRAINSWSIALGIMGRGTNFLETRSWITMKKFCKLNHYLYLCNTIGRLLFAMRVAQRTTRY
jgi:hypothetical protein